MSAKTDPDHGGRHRRSRVPGPGGGRRDARPRLARGLDGRARRHGGAPGARARLSSRLDSLRRRCAARVSLRSCCCRVNLLVGVLAERARDLRGIRPDVVLGMGGYVAFPGGMMASLLSRPLAVHEQNAVAGFANRVLARRRRPGAGGVSRALGERRVDRQPGARRHRRAGRRPRHASPRAAGRCACWWWAAAWARRR